MGVRIKQSRIASNVTEELQHVMNSEDYKIAHVVHRALPQIQNVIDRATAILEQRGRIFYFGAGTSGQLGVLDASECPLFLEWIPLSLMELLQEKKQLDVMLRKQMGM